jgi:two-component system, chemotaxis family, sensor kinase CheA
MPFSQDDQLKYKALYLQTAREYVKVLQENLTKLNSGNETEDIIDALHRDSHSLKGQSEMMGYHSIGALALLMEDIFRTKKENKLTLTPEIISQISAGVKEISVSLDEIEKVNKELDLFETMQKLKSLVPTVDE